MAKVFPFNAYRYSDAAGPLDRLVTQPYDKISPAMQARYLSLSPYNLVRIILGERLPGDNESENVYTRAAAYLEDWIRKGILVREPKPALFAYSQEFQVPDTGETAVRMGFIGLGAVEDYAEGVVHRHEQTLSGPKKDRLELLRHTRAHFGQIFMLYPDPQGEVDCILNRLGAREPDGVVTDEYEARHSIWKIADPADIERIQKLMSGKKLLIADGHHRYETALAFRNENPGLADAQKVMMTFVNMHSPGLRILATHRLVRGIGNPGAEGVQQKLGGVFAVRKVADLQQLRDELASAPAGAVRIGMAAAGSPSLYVLETARQNSELDVTVLHQRILAQALGIGEDAVRDERYLKYVRGLDAAVSAVRSGEGEVAFLLNPVSVDDVARIAFSGGVMPQKSTDFYPKLLSGMTAYKIER